jgi:hypothetical protein
MAQRKGSASKLKRGFKAWAEKQAEGFRKDLRLNPYDPLPAALLADHLGVPIKVPYDFPALEDVHLNNLLGAGSDHWSAATLPIGNGHHLVIHNPIHAKPRQESNLMHELAHIICKHDVPSTDSLPGFPGILRNFNDEQEEEAECLGATLQLPRVALSWALRRRMSAEEMADHFTASTTMVRFRINMTGVNRQYGRRA